jgi:rSAM/selenodomain-associated transferase 2
MPRPRLSVIIPTLDEEEALRASLPAALATADEVIVSDGGSSDGTVELARRHGVTVVDGAAGRGTQLNRGAAAATGDVLVFLHADTLPAADTRQQIEAAVAAGCAGGGSRMRFDVAGPLLRFGAAWINCRTVILRLPLGDQAQFATRDAFAAVEGFPPWPILEDLELMRRLKRRFPVAILQGPVTTSSRRFRGAGPVRTVARNWTIWLLYICGVAPQRLARLYRPH